MLQFIRPFAAQRDVQLVGKQLLDGHLAHARIKVEWADGGGGGSMRFDDLARAFTGHLLQLGGLRACLQEIFGACAAEHPTLVGKSAAKEIRSAPGSAGQGGSANGRIAKTVLLEFNRRLTPFARRMSSVKGGAALATLRHIPSSLLTRLAETGKYQKALRNWETDVDGVLSVEEMLDFFVPLLEPVFFP